MTHRRTALAIGLLAAAAMPGPLWAQDAAGGAAIPLARTPPAAGAGAGAAAPPNPARVEIVLGDIEVKLRSARIVLTLDPDRAAALAGAVSDAAVSAEPPDG